MNYVFRFPADISVSVHGSTANEELAYADAIAQVRESLKAVSGATVTVAFRKGVVVDKQADSDPRD